MRCGYHALTIRSSDEFHLCCRLQQWPRDQGLPCLSSCAPWQVGTRNGTKSDAHSKTCTAAPKQSQPSARSHTATNHAPHPNSHSLTHVPRRLCPALAGCQAERQLKCSGGDFGLGGHKVIALPRHNLIMGHVQLQNRGPRPLPLSNPGFKLLGMGGPIDGGLRCPGQNIPAGGSLSVSLQHTPNTACCCCCQLLRGFAAPSLQASTCCTSTPSQTRVTAADVTLQESCEHVSSMALTAPYITVITPRPRCPCPVLPHHLPCPPHPTVRLCGALRQPPGLQPLPARHLRLLPPAPVCAALLRRRHVLRVCQRKRVFQRPSSAGVC